MVSWFVRERSHGMQDAGVRKLRDALMQRPLDGILQDVIAGNYGRSHIVWDVIARRAKLHEAGWVLLVVLKSDADKAHRKQCAGALLHLLREVTITPDDLTSDDAASLAAISEVERRITETLDGWKKFFGATSEAS